MKFISSRELRNDIGNVLLTAQKEDLVITFKGKPKAILKGLKENELEDYIIANSPVVRKLLKEAEKDIKEGNLIDFDELIKKGKNL